MTRSRWFKLRWAIVVTLFLSTVINYINRQTLSVLAPVIVEEFHLSRAQYSQIVSAFQIAYAMMWLIGGVFLDLVGTRLGLALAMVWWSVASMLTGLANAVRSFSFFRFLLGMGEGCNWPGANKAVAEWIPARERSVAVAFFDSGSAVGAIVAPPLVAWIARAYGWRHAFVVSGVLGFFWLVPWLLLYHSPRRHPALDEEERALIERSRQSALAPDGGRPRLSFSLLGQRNVWGIVLGRSLTDPIWWFYVFWLPQYLSDARGFSLKQIGAFAWIPFLAADIGNFTGGIVSSALIKRGMPVIRARKWVCVASSVPILAGIPAALAQSPYWALAFISLANWGYASWATIGLTLPGDLFPQEVVASVTGLSGLGAGLLSTVFTLAVGALVDTFHSYFLAFLAAGLMPLVATACVLVLIRAPQEH